MPRRPPTDADRAKAAIAVKALWADPRRRIPMLHRKARARNLKRPLRRDEYST
jgi:hypothetical protein